MEERYTRNIPSISEADQTMLADRTVLVAGCGGLGGNIIELLARIGVGCIVVADGDEFSESNLNRQLLSTTENIGLSKVAAAVERVSLINPDVEVIAHYDFITAENAADLVSGVNLVIDALDNVSSRLILEDACAEAGVPLVHGAIHGWNLQVGVSMPGSGLLHEIYKADDIGDVSGDSENVRSDLAATCLAMTPSCCASIQIAQAIQLLIGEVPELAGKMLFIDMKTMECYTLPII